MSDSSDSPPVSAFRACREVNAGFERAIGEAREHRLQIGPVEFGEPTIGIAEGCKHNRARRCGQWLPARERLTSPTRLAKGTEPRTAPLLQVVRFFRARDFPAIRYRTEIRCASSCREILLRDAVCPVAM